MELQALINTGNPWLNKKIKTYITSFINETSNKFTSPIFLENTKAAKNTDREHVLTYFFCSPTDIDQDMIYQASPSFILSFFVSVECWAHKARLAILADYWARKRPNSILGTSLPETVCFELDYADFLDEKLDEPDLCFLRQSLVQNECNAVDQRDWWILKPSMTDGGYGIRFFSSIDELEKCFEKWEDDIAGDAPSESEELPHGRLRSSQLRSFVAQRYVASVPLLDGHKFHIRAYVLAMGRLRVFVHREMLVLVAPREYAQPWQPNALQSSLTNTSLQRSEVRTANRRRYWTSFKDDNWKHQTFKQICQITSDIFEAGVAYTASRFAHHPHCFDFFALDFLVDLSGKVWLLEVNSGPNINEEGDAGEVTQHVYRSVVYKTLGQLTGERVDEAPELVEVLNKDMGSNIPCFQNAPRE